jgi:hypothetical protein
MKREKNASLVSKKEEPENTPEDSSSGKDKTQKAEPSLALIRKSSLRSSFPVWTTRQPLTGCALSPKRVRSHLIFRSRRYCTLSRPELGAAGCL